MNLQIKNTPAMLRLLISVLAVFTGTTAFAADKGARNSEQLEQLLKRFPDADTNKDGTFTMEEARAYFRKMKSAKSGDAPAGPAAAAKLLKAGRRIRTRPPPGSSRRTRPTSPR